jgi:hypothetical protein
MLLASLLFALGTAAVPTLGGPPLKRQIYPSAAQFAIYYDNNYCSGDPIGNSVPDGYCYVFPTLEYMSLDLTLLEGDCQSKT